MSIKQIFDAFDTDKNGSLDQKEFSAICRAFGDNVDEEKIAAGFQKIDADGNGQIDFAEFEPAAAQRLKEIPDLKYLVDFRALDADCNGLLSKEEIAQLATKLGKSVDAAKIAEADKNGDGNLNYKEFVALMQ